MLRLFVALRPPPATRAALIAAMGGVRHARWQDDAQLHCTLRFVGAIERPQAEDLAAALGGVHAPVPLVRIAGVGRFDHKGRTDTLWAGLAPAEPLHHLARKVEQACVRAGLPPERRAYRPHVTLARLARSAGAAPEIDGWLAAHAGLATAPFAMSHLILYQSHLGHGGAAYAPVARWPLAAAGEFMPEPRAIAPGSSGQTQGEP